MMAPEPVRAVLGVAADAGRHAAWWLRYRLTGQTRPAPPEPPRRGSSERRSAE
jgi:hypothetical protein